MVGLYSKLKNFKGVFLLINNNHNKETDFLNLLNKNNINCLAVYKQKPNYIYQGKNIILNKLNFFYFVLVVSFLKNQKILITSQPYFAFPYIFFSKSTHLYAYDTHIGLNYVSKFKILIERVVLYFFKNIIHRDLRTWVYYKKFLKNPKRKNLFLPDYISSIHSSDKNKIIPIKCAFIGWADDKNVKVDKSVKKFLEFGIEVHFFSKKNSYEMTKKLINLNNNEEKLLHYEGEVFGSKFHEKLKKFQFGLCPHDAEKPKISKNYRKYCSSLRIYDYLNNNMTIILSESALYQKYIIKSHNGKYIHLSDLYSITNKEELLKNINKNKILIKSKYFKQDYLASKLATYLNINFELN